jgi:hypothetical protein
VSQLEQVLSTGDPNTDSENGHPIAYSQILQAASSYENPPIFLREDSEQITNDPIMSEKVPEWMCTAAQVATGYRRRVLEDEEDKIDSDDEAIEDMEPDEEKNMYTPEMDPEKGPMKLTQAQAAAQKAAAQAMKIAMTLPRSQTPVSNSSDDDEPTGPEWIWSQTRGCMRRNKHFPKAAASAPQKIETRPPPAISVPDLKATAVPPRPPTPKASPVIPVKSKAAASQKAPAGKPVTEAKASHPMETRKTASRAGGLRPVGGSGQTGTCVAQGNHLKT